MAITKDIQLFQAQENEAKKVTLKDHVAYRNRQPETVAKDFNTYTETGFYTWSITANILQDCANRPCDEFGILEVKNDNTAIIYQRYEANNNVVYIRTFYNEAWTEWDIEVNKDYVDTALEALQGDVNQDLSGMQNTINQINQNVAKKINRTDTKTFFLEPSKWVDSKYTLDVTGFGWTANTIIQINAPMPESNVELASGISIESQSSIQVVLKSESAPTEPVILTLLYGGEETTGYYVVDEIGEQTIIVQEEQVNNDIIVIANPTSSKTFENIHPNSTSFTSRNASNIYFNPGTLDFADIYLLYKYNGQTIVNIDGQGFDFTKPWILHWYITTSYGNSGTLDGIAQMVGFYSDSNANTNSIFSVNWNKSSDDGKERYGLYYNGNSKGQADAPETKNTVTNSQIKLVYDGTNITLYKMTMRNGFQPIVRSPIQFTETIKSIVFGSNSKSFKDNFGLGSFILMNGTELPEIVVREDWNNKQCWSSKHIVDVEKVINVIEKAWYKNEPDGLYKWDTATNTWIKQ